MIGPTVRSSDIGLKAFPGSLSLRCPCCENAALQVACEPSASAWPRPGRRSRARLRASRAKTGRAFLSGGLPSDYAGLRAWKVRRRSLIQASGFSQGMKWPP